MTTHDPNHEIKSVQATVTVHRLGGGYGHGITVTTPEGQVVTFYLDKIEANGTRSAFVHWADYNLNRPATPIEELVDEFQSAVYEETVNRSMYSHAKSTVEEDKAKLLAAIIHLQANHAEMVARNAMLRRRPDLPQECGHPKQCIGKVHEEDELEKEHCLWCGDITDMAMLVKHCSTIYSAITDGRISKPNTLPEEVERVAGDLETERTDAAVKDALADNGDSYRDHLYEDQRQIVPYTGEFEPGASVTIHWKAIPGEVDGPTVDHGYVFVFPHEDAEVGACVHIPHPDPRGDRDVSPEWPTVNYLLANILIERIEFTNPMQELKDQIHGMADWLWQGLAATPQEAASRLYALAGVSADSARRLDTVDERYAHEVKLIEHLDKLGVIRIQRGKLLSEVMIADKELSKGNAA